MFILEKPKSFLSEQLTVSGFDASPRWGFGRLPMSMTSVLLYFALVYVLSCLLGTQELHGKEQLLGGSRFVNIGQFQTYNGFRVLKCSLETSTYQDAMMYSAVICFVAVRKPLGLR